MKQCKDFEIASENSDAECFVDKESELLLNDKPNLCEICVYNKKYDGMNWEQWVNYRKKIGVEPK